MLDELKVYSEEKGILNSALPVRFRGENYFIEVEFLLEKAEQLEESRIHNYTLRILKADRLNDSKSITNTLQALARELMRYKKIGVV